MPVPNALRSRRLRHLQAEKTVSVITFPLGEYWFALPTVAVQKVIQLGKIYGDPRHSGVSLTSYQNQEILVIDVQYRIFARSPRRTLLETAPDRFLLIVPRSDGEPVGLPIDSPPAIRRVPESAFLPLPPSYHETGNIACLADSIIEIPDTNPIFLLDPEKLK